MNLDRCVRWLKLAGLIREIGQTVYIVLRKIEEYDLWYRANQDEPFFFGEEAGGDPFAFIAEESGVEKEHLQKRTLPLLKKEEFLDYWMENGIWWFKLNWNKFFDIYCKKAYTIPFKEDGLKNIPANYSGVIRPTPFHCVKIENGKVVPWNGGKVEVNNILSTEEKTADDALKIELRCLNPAMDKKEIAFCLSKKNETEIALKLLKEMNQQKRMEIKNEAAYVLEMVKRGPKTPQGFVILQKAKEKEEEKIKLEEFLKKFKEKNCQYFCPKENIRYEILKTDESYNQGFFITKEDAAV